MVGVTVLLLDNVSENHQAVVVLLAVAIPGSGTGDEVEVRGGVGPEDLGERGVASVVALGMVDTEVPRMRVVVGDDDVVSGTELF